MRQVVLIALLCMDVVGAASESTAAMAMAGGGFRALTSNAGITSGLLSFIGKQEKIAKPTFSGTGLLERFNIYSSVSGGSWYFSELAYSESFRSLQEDIAISPENCSNLFNAKWFDPFKKVTGVDPIKFDPLHNLAIKVVTEVLGKADEDTIFTFQYVLSTNGTWNEFVRTVLSSTAAIDYDMTLNAPVDTWAKGKDWLADHTVLLPSAEKPAILFEGAGLDAFQNVKYSAQGNGSIPEFIPAKFSVTMGSGNSFAPYPYIAPSAAPGLQSFEYKGVVVPVLDKPSANSGPLGDDLAGGALTGSALPIWGAASASSAALGGIAIYGDLANEVGAVLHGDFTPWVSKAPDGASFATGLDLVHDLDKVFGDNKKNIQALASNAVHGVMDGAYTDNSGFANAVAAGATEVLVFLNAGVGGSPDIELLSTDGPNSTVPGAPSDLYPVFLTPASAVRTAFQNFHQLVLPNGTQFLKNLSAGTFQMVTTDNKYFGTTSGQPVTVHVVQTCSNLSIGFFAEYVNYGTFAQEIALAINSKENEEYVKSTLLPMVMGATAAAAATSPILI